MHGFALGAIVTLLGASQGVTAESNNKNGTVFEPYSPGYSSVD